MPGGFGGFGGMPAGGGGGRSFHFSTGGPGGGSGGFQFNNAEDIFADFLRSSGGGSGGLGSDDMEGIFSAFGGSGRGPSGRSRSAKFGTGPEPVSNRPQRPQTPEVMIVERPLPLTLEEMFNGTHKKMKMQQKSFDENGKRTVKDRIMEMDIKPGLKKGSKIKFHNVGDQEEGGRQDLHFVVEEVGFIHFPRNQYVMLTVSLEKTPSLHSRQ